MCFTGVVFSKRNGKDIRQKLKPRLALQGGGHGILVAADVRLAL